MNDPAAPSAIPTAGARWAPNVVMASLSWVVGLSALGCGGVTTAGVRPDGVKANDSFLVQVVDGMPEHPVRLVSVAVVEADREGNLPEALPDDEIERMRTEAGQRGAEYLYVERISHRHRKAFYGLGLLPDRAAADPARRGLTPGVCTHPRVASEMSSAQKRATACLASLKKARPALQGKVIVSFLVDPFGTVYQAGPMPESSKDSQAVACGVAAVNAVDWGEHGDLLCRATVQASL